MSGILAFVAGGACGTRGDALASALPALVAVGGDDVASWCDADAGVRLAAVRHPREGRGGASLHVAADVAVVADASLVHARALAQAVRAAGVPVAVDASAAALVAAAWAAWGIECFARLEGDFAVALWDGRRRVLHAARDFAGTRPLFHARAGGALAVASAVAPLLRLPGVDAALDHAVLAESASWIFRDHARTVHRGVARVRPGTVATLDARAGNVEERRHWEAPVFERDGGAPGFDDAAEQLRELLRDAVRARVAPDGITAVWMSGGYDSTAVFAAGRDGGAAGLFPVSVSYPVGDTGREDEAIRLVAQRWGAEVRWLSSADVDLFARFEDAVASADEPFVHLYDGFNAALAHATAAAGARVALGGYGGDQLFWASQAYLADLLAGGRLRTLARELRALRLGPAALLEWMVRPLLPDAAFGPARRLGAGARWLAPLEQPVPAWIAPRAARDAGLAGAFRREHPRRAGESRSAWDTRYALENPFYARVLEAIGTTARAHGVEYRSPLYDRRLVAFAATRPRWERTSGGRQKHLLRRAMQGLLPASVLAPRPFKTGTTRDLFARSARRWLPPVLARVAREPRLADLGVLDADRFRAACATFLRTGDPVDAGVLMPALQVELWLRGAERRAAPAAHVDTPAQAARPVHAA